MKKIVSIFLVIAISALFAVPCFAQDKWDELLVESARVFEEMTDMPDEGIPQSLIEDCYAIAIFPSTVSGGFIIGAKYGQGVIVAKDHATGKWSYPAVFNLAGGSFGWQIGGQAIDTILLIMSERGLNGLLQSKFKLGGDAAIAAGPVGRDAEAATDLQLKGGILTYSRSRGLFIGLKLAGSVVSFNEEANTSLYEPGVSARTVLIEQKVSKPEYSFRLMKSLSVYEEIKK